MNIVDSQVGLFEAIQNEEEHFMLRGALAEEYKINLRTLAFPFIFPMKKDLLALKSVVGGNLVEKIYKANYRIKTSREGIIFTRSPRQDQAS